MTNQQLQLIESLRHALHQCPEISGQEVRTKALLQQFLREHTTLELLPCGTGRKMLRSLRLPCAQIMTLWRR